MPGDFRFCQLCLCHPASTRSWIISNPARRSSSQTWGRDRGRWRMIGWTRCMKMFRPLALVSQLWMSSRQTPQELPETGRRREVRGPWQGSQIFRSTLPRFEENGRAQSSNHWRERRRDHGDQRLAHPLCVRAVQHQEPGRLRGRSRKVGTEQGAAPEKIEAERQHEERHPTLESVPMRYRLASKRPNRGLWQNPEK